MSGNTLFYSSSVFLKFVWAQLLCKCVDSTDRGKLIYIHLSKLFKSFLNSMQMFTGFYAVFERRNFH